jgi:polyferredoxin
MKRVYQHASACAGTVVLWLFAAAAEAQNRFPKPDFESGYQYPATHFRIPDERWWTGVDLLLLTLLMSLVAWAVLRKRTRRPVFWVSVVSVAYFGFFRNGCVCSIGAIQNVSLALVDTSYVLPPAILLFFILPVIFTLLFGRVFCGGVCPFGALQDLVHIRSGQLPRAWATVLGVIPWMYLFFSILFAVTHSRFLLCRYDPFIGIFRLGGDIGILTFGVLLLLAAVFTGRPFCRFLCPYGALLSLFARVSVWRMRIVPVCINCDLCRQACPVDAIRPPYENRVRESRMAGVKRILTYVTVLPLLSLTGALILHLMSETLSHAHKDIRLYDLVMRNEQQPQTPPLPEVEAFYGHGGTVSELTGRTEKIRREFDLASTLAGACMGLAVGLTLISLSVKRTRKTYEIDDTACVNCGKCFSYCPQNRRLPDLNTRTPDT